MTSHQIVRALIEDGNVKPARLAGKLATMFDATEVAMMEEIQRVGRWESIADVIIHCLNRHRMKMKSG